MSLIVPDFESYSFEHRCRHAKCIGQVVAVTFTDGETFHAPLIWLREFSPDESTHHPVTREQTILLNQLPPDLGVDTIGIDSDGFLTIKWMPENLSSRYHPGWLYTHMPDSEESLLELPDHKLWDSSLHLDRLAGDRMLNGDEEVFEQWLKNIHVDGVGLLTQLPLDEDLVPKIPMMIGPVRASNFGNIFTVEVLANADSNAYTSIYLSPHTDLSTREYPPGLQFLFSLANDAQGGETILVDGFHLAEVLKSESAEFYEVLSTMPVPFVNKAEDSEYRYRAPVINLNREGQLDTIRFTYWLRAPMKASNEDLATFYAAFIRFHELAEEGENQFRFKLQPGEMIGFDNRRVLHGRTAFNLETGRRKLMGCYGEREELLSRLRLLARSRRARQT